MLAFLFACAVADDAESTAPVILTTIADATCDEDYAPVWDGDTPVVTGTPVSVAAWVLTSEGWTAMPLMSEYLAEGEPFDVACPPEARARVVYTYTE